MRERRKRQIQQMVEIAFITLGGAVGLIGIYLFAMYLKG
jgi:hypothetical protein